ncbi:MAG: hypothetical protein ACE144_18610 [Thermodesulfobacteriota bacterium]
MRYHRGFFGFVLLFFGLVSFGFAEDFSLHYFLEKVSSQKVELAKKEREELFNRIDEVFQQAREIHSKLLQTIQTGETEIRYQEGKFWMSKLEEDRGTIENGIQQIKLLKDKPSDLAASVKLYKSLRDLSSNFNAYNNTPLFSALVGDLAPEMGLWADPTFYQLCLLPLAQMKGTEKSPPPKVKKPTPKEKKP